MGNACNYKENLEEVFSHFPVSRERSNQLEGSLSGAERQMLAVTNALMSSPRILLLDVPPLRLEPLIVEQNVYAALKGYRRTYVLEVGEVMLEGYSISLMENGEAKRKYMGR